MARELTRPGGEGPLSRLEPGNLFDQLRRQVDYLFESFPRGWGGLSRAFGEAGAYVPVDVEETEEGVRVQAEMPGMSEKDIEVSLEPGGEELSIRGEKKSERESTARGLYRAERAYGSFERTITLPVRVDESKIEAHFKNGVLAIEMSKAEEAKGRKKIEIKPS